MGVLERIIFSHTPDEAMSGGLAKTCVPGKNHSVPEKTEFLIKDREYFQYNSRDLVYLISPLTSQLRTASRKVAIRYVGPLVIYKIVDPHNYLLMTMDGKLLRGVFEHERLKPGVLKTDQGNVSTLPA